MARGTSLDVGLFTLMLTLSCILVGIACFSIYRQVHLPKKAIHGNLNKARYLLLFSCTLQILVFLGYLTNDLASTQIAWNLWVPTGTAHLGVLTIKMSSNYLTIIKQKPIKQKYHYIMYKKHQMCETFSTLTSKNMKCKT